VVIVAEHDTADALIAVGEIGADRGPRTRPEWSTGTAGSSPRYIVVSIPVPLVADRTRAGFPAEPADRPEVAF